MIEKQKNFVRSSELPICPFCNGKIYYKNLTTHRIFHIECEKCKAHWRSGIKNNENREMFMELICSRNPEISNEYLNKKLPINFWINLLKNKIDKEF